MLKRAPAVAEGNIVGGARFFLNEHAIVDIDQPEFDAFWFTKSCGPRGSVTSIAVMRLTVVEPLTAETQVNPCFPEDCAVSEFFHLVRNGARRRNSEMKPAQNFDLAAKGSACNIEFDF